MADVGTQDDKPQRDIVLIVYIMQAIGFFIGITWIVGVIMNYVKRDETRGTWLETHHNWQIKTFWVGVIGSILSFILMIVVIGLFTWFAVGIWCIYRVIKGWLAFNDRKELGNGLF
jgi:uncharacterized membrane protein